LASETERLIEDEAVGRGAKPRAILDDPSRGIDAAFVDDLGQLLVKRTILLLRAGEDERAWRELSEGVSAFYQTPDGVELLVAEISELLP